MDIIKLIPSNLRFFLLMIPSLITLPGIWLVVVKLHELSFKTILTTRKKIDYNRIIFCYSNFTCSSSNYCGGACF
jgi:hypothetical protein